MLVLHGDVDFTPEQRRWTGEAVALITAQAAGLVDIAITYDLNFRDDAAIERSASQSTFVSLTGTSSVVTYAESEHCRNPGCLVGLTSRPSVADPNDALARVYIIPERLPGHDRFVSVVEHELMHALGVEHVSHDAHAVMGPTVSAPPALCWTPADRAAFCAAWRCDPTALGDCPAR